MVSLSRSVDVAYDNRTHTGAENALPGVAAT